MTTITFQPNCQEKLKDKNKLPKVLITLMLGKFMKFLVMWTTSLSMKAGEM